MPEDAHTDAGSDEEPEFDSDVETDDGEADAEVADEQERPERGDEPGTQSDGDAKDGLDEHDDAREERVDIDQTSGGAVERFRDPGQEPDVSVTIEGPYDTVFERLEHPQGLQHGEFDAIAGNIESTLLAVVRNGGGIRSEIYDAVDFELEEPWEIRIYLEVLEMHDLIRLQDDRWVPSDSQEQETRSDGAQ